MPQIKFTAEMLDSDEIKSFMQPLSLSSLSVLSVFDSIASTNSYLLECAKSGAESGSVCIAEQQSRGRGRQGRTWYSPRGANIYCSWLWNFPAQNVDLSALSLAVGVMVSRCLKKYGVETGIQLKWPNDVLYQGRKLAGILLESVSLANGQLAMVVGIGLNLKLPDDYPEATNWIDVAEITGAPIKRNYLAGLLIDEVLVGLAHFQAKGFADFMPEWMALDALRGENVAVHMGAKVVQGVMQGINEQGELLLQTESDGLVAFRCGEVSVRFADDDVI